MGSGFVLGFRVLGFGRVFGFGGYTVLCLGIAVSSQHIVANPRHTGDNYVLPNMFSTSQDHDGLKPLHECESLLLRVSVSARHGVHDGL